MLDTPMESLACPEHICPSPVDRVAAGDGELCAPTVDDQVVVVRPQRRGEAKPFLPHSRQVLSEPDPFRCGVQARTDRLSLRQDKNPMPPWEWRRLQRSR